MEADRSEAWMLAAAQALGTHATLAFFVTLAGLMAVTVLGWTLWQRGAPHLPRWRHRSPALLLALYTGIGFAVITATAAVFAEMTEAMDADDELGRLDEALTGALRQSVSPTVLRGFAWLTRLGDRGTLVALALVVAALLWWHGRRWLALGWAVALGGNGLLNPLLKAVFARARPEHAHGLVAEGGYSFPSGHSSGAVVAYGMGAYLLLRVLPPRWRLPVLVGATALVFGIACSRIFLQVHWPTDVLAGLASGTAWLAVCVLGIEALRGAWRRGAAEPLP